MSGRKVPCRSSRRHDTLVAYLVDYCRCPLARTAHARDEKQRRLEALAGITRSVPAAGTIRRVRALMALGWRSRDIGAAAGYTAPNEVTNLCHRVRVNVSTARRIADVYDRLSGTPGPSDQTRRRAARRGYAPPLAWDDDTIDDPTARPTGVGYRPERSKAEIDEVNVERARGGARVDLTRAERLEVVRRLRTIDRLDYNAIAAHLHVAQRQVHRDLTDLGLVEAGAA